MMASDFAFSGVTTFSFLIFFFSFFFFKFIFISFAVIGSCVEPRRL